MPFVSLQQIPVNCLLLTLSALEFYSLLPDKCQHKAMVIFAAFQTSQLSQVFCIQTPRYPCFPLSKDIAWPLLIPFALVRLTPTLMVSILMSFSYVLRNLFSSLGSCCTLFLACSSAHQKPSLLGADSFSFGNSPGSPHSHLSGLWMALMLLCIAVCQFIIHWLVTLLVQLWAVTYLSYICSPSLQISCLMSSSSLRTQSTSLAFFFVLLSALLTCHSCPTNISGISRFNFPQVSPTFLV